MTQEYLSVIQNFANAKVLVIGDVMLDTYWWGNTNRISPEAPVPVIDVQKVEHRAGGAANVALNTISFGAATFLCGVVGDDENGKLLKQLLVEKNINIDGLIVSTHRKTTQKNRAMSRNQQLLRFDIEDKNDLDSDTSDIFILTIQNLLEKHNIEVIILQDYDKGVLNQNNINSIIKLASKYQIKFVVDPKFKHFFHYTGAFIFKPNLKEALDAMPFNFNQFDEILLSLYMKQLIAKLNVEYLILTLSEHGIASIDQKNNFFYHPVIPRNIVDVSGAGDSVIAILALCGIQNLPMNKTIYLANIVGGLACESVGVTPITLFQLQQQLQVLKSPC